MKWETLNCRCIHTSSCLSPFVKFKQRRIFLWHFDLIRAKFYAFISTRFEHFLCMFNQSFWAKCAGGKGSEEGGAGRPAGLGWMWKWATCGSSAAQFRFGAGACRFSISRKQTRRRIFCHNYCVITYASSNDFGSLGRSKYLVKWTRIMFCVTDLEG